MHSFLKQSTASQSRAIGPFLDDGDFKTPETGLTIANTDIKLVVNGAASANKNSGGGTHRVNGVYGVTFDATDTATVGEMHVSVVVAGALPVFATFIVVEEAVYDMLFGGSALGYINNAPVNVAQFGGSNGTFSSGRAEVNTTHWAGTAVGSATVNANVTQISGDSGAADNCEAYFDGTGYTDVDNLAVIRSGTAQAGAAGTITLDSGASASDNFYNNNYIQITGGTGAGQSRFISDYTGSSKVADISPNWVTNPSSDSVFIIWPFGSIPGASAPTAAEVADAVWDEATAGHTTSGTFGEQLKTDVDAILVDTGTTLDGKIDTIDNNVDAILVDTAEIGAAGAGLTAVPWNAAWDAQVESEVADALAVYDPPTKAELDAAVANVSVDEIQATALADLFNTDSGTTYGSAVAGSVVAEIADNAGGSSLTVSDIADEVQTRTIAAVTVVNGLANNVITANSIAANAITAGKIATDAIDADALAADAIAEINATVDTAISDAALATAANLATVDTVVDAIKVKTDSLTFTVSGKVDANITHVNEAEVAGDGQPGTEWGPA